MYKNLKNIFTQNVQFCFNFSLQKKELMMFSMNYLESTIPATKKLIDFFIDYGLYDNNIHSSIQCLIDGYHKLIAVFPYIITGKLNGRNIKDELIYSLHNTQVALHFCEEDPERLRQAWKDFIYYWVSYRTHTINLIESNKFENINLN